MLKDLFDHYRLQISLGVLGLVLMSFVAATLIAPPAHAAECASVETTVISCDSQVSGDSQTSGIWSLLLIVINIMTAGIGVLAVAGFVYAAVLWTTAEDKADQLNKAKDIILNTCIGLVSFGLMYSLLQFLVPGGVFNSISAPKVSISKQNDLNPGLEDCGCDTGDNTGGGTGDGSGGGEGGDGSISTADIKTVKNLRDVAASNNNIKPGVLFRSGQLSNLNDANAKKLSKLLGNGATIIDLRKPPDPSDTAVSGARNISYPIQGILDTAPMVNDPARYKQLAKALKTAGSAKGSVLVHCVAGKDRTGWTIAMIMYVNGASDDEVMTEYLKSNDTPNNGIVKREWLNHGLQEARSQHGTIIKYLKFIGLSDANIKNLRTKFGK